MGLQTKSPEDLIVALGGRRYRVDRPYFADAGTGGVISDVAAAPDGNLYVLIRYDRLALAGGHAVATVVNGGVKTGHWAAQKQATLGLGMTRATRRRPVSRAPQTAGG